MSTWIISIDENINEEDFNIIINIGYKEYSSAIITSAFVSRLDKVETTRYLTNLYREVSNTLTIKDEVDYISAILATGRVLDLKIENGALIEGINNLVNRFRDSVTTALTSPIIGTKDREGAEKLIKTYVVNDNDIASALLTTSYVFLTHEIETIKKITELWSIIRNTQIVQHKLDYLAAILATGKIRDLKSKVNVPIEIKQIILDLKRIATQRYKIKFENLDQRDISCGLITAAYVSITPPIETNSQILDLWNNTRANAKLGNSDLDFLVAILICGLIRGIKLEEDWDFLNSKIETMKNTIV